MNSEYIKSKALEYGAAVCSIANIDRFRDQPAECNPLSVLPWAKSVIGFGFYVPSGFYRAMENGAQHYLYTSVGVKYIDEELTTVFLCKMARIIEDEGYDACTQRSVPNMRVKGDKSANPEVTDVYELIYSEPVSPEKPAPEVILNTNIAAVLCGMGKTGLNGRVINPKYGPLMRYCFIITDMELEPDPLIETELCDRCGECIKACVGNAISEVGVDSWQCAVYYRGAHRSNPFMTDGFLKGNPEREAILNGEKRFTPQEAREIFKQMNFLPNTQSGYVPCLCGKSCDYVCFKHLKEAKII